MKFTRLTSTQEVETLIDFHNRNSTSVVIDVETTSKEPRKAQLIDMQISGSEPESAVIFGAEFSPALLELSPNIILIAHSYKYDAHVLYRHEVDLLARKWRDTLLIGHLLDENRDSYSLDSYVKEYWQDAYKEEFWKKNKSYHEVAEAEREIYACKDIIYTRRLFERFADLLHSGEGVPDSLVDHVHRLQAALLKTEIKGIAVDKEYLTDLGVKLKYRINELEPQMRGLVADAADVVELRLWEKQLSKYKSDKGRRNCPRPTFNFASGVQLQSLLYGVLELPKQFNEKTKSVSTDYESLQKIRDDHPVVPLIQEHKELQKVYGSYIEGTLERLDNGRIYPSFRVNGTATGRISHSNPNLGQLPKSGGVRGIYVPDQGHVILSADYSQLEVCLEANLTGDVSLARIFREKLSKHDITSQELGIERDQAKTLNFALQYWASHFKVAKLLGVSIEEGLKIWNNYWKLYSGPRALKARTDSDVDSGRSLQTIFGRKRRFQFRKRSPWDGDYRQAYNFLIQSLGADITSLAFYFISEELEKAKEGRGLFTVHDEILIEVRNDFVEKWEARLLEIMVSVGDDLGLKIPLKAESSGSMLRWLD